jgi:hypothetical protein
MPPHGVGADREDTDSKPAANLPLVTTSSSSTLSEDEIGVNTAAPDGDEYKEAENDQEESRKRK